MPSPSRSAPPDLVRRALHEAPHPALIFADDGAVCFVNAVWQTVTGYDDLPTIDAWLDALHAGEEGLRPEDLKHLFALEGRLHLGEVALQPATGKPCIWDFSAAPLGPLPDGRRTVLLMATDVTQRRAIAEQVVAARNEAEQMAHLQRAFLANMSHEIRTPLTGIIGFAAVMAKEATGDHREFAELIEQSGRRLLDMLNSVMDVAKLESGQTTLRREVVNLEAEIRNILQLLMPLANDAGLTLEVDIAPEAAGASAHLDGAAFNRVLNNLVSNALKFTDEGGVTVRLDAPDDVVRVQVQDTGIGIDPAFLPHLFEEFRQESSGLSRSHEGSGLGLSITRRLVQLMDGTIEVDSAKGAGSTFTVTFPRVHNPLETVTEEVVAAAPEDDAGQRLRVLMVEDNRETQYLLLELMETSYDLTLAATAEEAVRLARHEHYDVVLMDIHLGAGPSGAEAMQTLRGMPAYADTPIVALTAYALPGDRERFLQQGFTAYVSKPFAADELLALPERLVAGKAVEEG